jgi:predicted amidophosphoribosyltransferase
MVSNKDNNNQNYKFNNKRNCQSCGKKNSMTAEFCIECGKKLPKFEIPFINKNFSAEDLIKDKNEKSIVNSLNLKNNSIEMPEKKETIKNEKVLDNVDDFLQNKIKNLDPNTAKNTCQNCGNNNPSDAKFCITCGKPLQKTITSKIESKKLENNGSLNKKEDIISNHIDIKKKYVEIPKKKEILEDKKPLNDIQINDQSDPKLNTQICQNCGNINKSKAKFCVTCGKLLEKTMTPKIESKLQDNIKSLNKTKDINSNLADIQNKPVEKIKDENVSSNHNSKINPLDAIKKANELLQIGAITEEEFETIKIKYIKKI